MKITEIVDSAGPERIATLDQNAKRASYALKQERYRQRMQRYSERINNLKPGQQMPTRPEAPKIPSTK